MNIKKKFFNFVRFSPLTNAIKCFTNENEKEIFLPSHKHTHNKNHIKIRNKTFIQEQKKRIFVKVSNINITRQNKKNNNFAGRKFHFCMNEKANGKEMSENFFPLDCR